MKKTIASLGLLALGLSLGACQSPVEIPKYDASKYMISEKLNDGVYKEVAEGRNGNFEVEVIIKEGKLSEIGIGKNDETEGKGDVALEKVRESILALGKPDVDEIAGATYSSVALKDAVAKALVKASESGEAHEKI